MMFISDDSRTRAVVKNTFIHIERVSEHFDARCQSKRRKSDASDVRHSLQPEFQLDVDFTTQATTGPSSVAPLAELGVALSLRAVRPSIKNTFLHVETAAEDVSESNALTRLSRRRLSDLLHARNADAESYKFEKEASIKSESETLAQASTPPQHEEEDTDSESNLGCTSTCSSMCSVDSECSTSAGGSAFTPQESAGSAGHSQGLCRPCVWFWRPTSCSKGSSCEYCHMCDEGAVARAVASKKAMKKRKAKTMASR